MPPNDLTSLRRHLGEAYRLAYNLPVQLEIKIRLIEHIEQAMAEVREVSESMSIPMGPPA